MRIVCWQTILMKYHTLIGKDVTKFVVYCSCDWRLKSYESKWTLSNVTDTVMWTYRQKHLVKVAVCGTGSLFFYLQIQILYSALNIIQFYLAYNIQPSEEYIYRESYIMYKT